MKNLENLDGWRGDVAGLGVNTEQAGGSHSKVQEGLEFLGDSYQREKDRPLECSG